MRQLLRFWPPGSQDPPQRSYPVTRLTSKNIVINQPRHSTIEQCLHIFEVATTERKVYAEHQRSAGSAHLSWEPQLAL